MAKLPDTYFDTPQNQGASAPVIPSMSTSGTTIPSPFSMLPIKPTALPMNNLPPDNPNKPDAIHLFSDLTPEEQKAKFGYEVGSQQYNEAVAKGPGNITPGKAGPSFIPAVANAFGVRLPQGEEWDKMRLLDKIATTDVAVTNAAGRMIRDLPKAVLTGIASVGLTAIKPFYNLFTGKSPDSETLRNEPILKLPYLGEVPTIYQDQKKAEESGMGPIASHIFAVSNLVLNAAMILPVTEMLANTFRPRGPIGTAGPVKNTEPIKYAMNKENGVYSKAPESSSEYYTLRKSDAKQFGGNINDTKWKFTPADENKTSISVVKSIKGKVGEYIKTDFGLKRIEQGDFGPEVKLYTADVPTGPIAKPKSISTDVQGYSRAPGEYFHGTNKNFDKFLTDKFSSGEGSDLWGQGVYLTESPETAKFYSKQSTRGDVFAGINDLEKSINDLNNQIKEIENSPNYGEGKLFSEGQKLYDTNRIKTQINQQSESLNQAIVKTTKVNPDTKLFKIEGTTPREYVNDPYELEDLKKIGFSNKEIQQIRIDTGGGSAELDTKEFSRILQSKGYDGIEFSGGLVKNIPGKGKNVVIFNPDKIEITNREKLFDIKKQDTYDPGTVYKSIGDVLKNKEGKLPPVFILPKERVGLSNRPITPAQIDTLNNISQMKNMDPAIKDAVIKSITGKDSIGSLVEKDYVNVAQTLSKFGEKYGVKSATLGPTGYVQKWLAPQRHYFNYVEDTFGYPLKTQIYDKFERAAQLTKILDSSLQPELDNLFGKYTSPKFVEERRLIDAYARGDKSAITANSAIDSTVKTELIDVANKLKVWDETYGEILGVGKDAYLQNYGGPKITNTGGVIPQYKNLETIPSKNFFAKFKREGSFDPFIDDPYASRQIYIKEGSKALHFGPALENFDTLSKSLPANFLRDANSYVQEKLGRLGGVEKFLDSFVPAINKKLGIIGINLPADASRQAINYGLSSLYSGLVGTPQSAFKQIFQLPLFVYSRLGTRFAGEALLKSMNSEFRTHVAKLGYLNEISLPYGAELTKDGAELTKDFSLVGKLGNTYKNFTQATLKPMTYVDNDVRIKTFAQAELQWNNAINLFNQGKIDWSKLEMELDFGAFSKTDRNTIRQGLIAGDFGEKSNSFTTYMREIIDETSFPYRTGAGARVGYGLTGKLATGLLNYTIESINVLSKWATTGQWDKLIRFAGTAKAMDDTMKEQFGFDFSSTLYQKVSGIVSPAVQIVTNFYNYFDALINNQRQTMNDNRDQILKSLKSGLPLGIATKNVSNFYKSISVGQDSSGQYPIYDNYGKLIDNGDFNDLFWGSLIGFSTVKKTNERNLYNDIKNSQVEETDIRNQINQLLREGKYDEMEKLVEKTGIIPSQNTMESAYVPRTQRLFETLSPQLKVKYVPRVFPETVTK